jgi:murein L,D-transpeptidase YcbB/YkuD
MSFHAIAQRKTNERELAKGTLYSKNLGLPGQEFFESDHTLNYPHSVARFYKAMGYKLQWVEKNHHNKQIVPAMILLDCVQQFGLNQADFHPGEINYDKLEALKSRTDFSNEKERENFDVDLTDAMITFMNYLHYGKFNTNYNSIKTDWDSSEDFNTVSKLIAFMDSKDFYTAVTSVQPALKEYDDLQKYMHLVRGQYMGDNYEFPEEKVRGMVINMERLRWLSLKEGNHIMLNIPSNTLKLYAGDSTYNFKTLVGAPTAPTPSFESGIKHFSVSPTVKTNHFSDKSLRMNTFVYFDDTSVITLHDIAALPDETVQGNLGIGVKNLQRLSMLLLEQDGSGQRIPTLRKAFEKYTKLDFVLRKSMPVAVIYLTCEILKGQLMTYPDVYHLDQILKDRMYINSAPIMMVAEIKK